METGQKILWYIIHFIVAITFLPGLIISIPLHIIVDEMNKKIYRRK